MEGELEGEAAGEEEIDPAEQDQQRQVAAGDGEAAE